MSCNIGSWGWKHPEWENDVFYPDDLPSDWRLSYYANEFDMVVVPAEYWTADGYGDEDEDWLDDVTEAFSFYIDWPFLQMTSQAEYEACADFCQSLEKQLAAILINDDVWGQLSSDQKQWFESITKDFKVLQYQTETESKNNSGFANVYDDKNQAEGEQILLLHSDNKENLRDLGGRLGQLLNSSNQSSDGDGTNIQHIVLSNEVVEIQRLQELKTLITLLVD